MVVPSNIVKAVIFGVMKNYLLHLVKRYNISSSTCVSCNFWSRFWSSWTFPASNQLMKKERERAGHLQVHNGIRIESKKDRIMGEHMHIHDYSNDGKVHSTFLVAFPVGS